MVLDASAAIELLLNTAPGLQAAGVNSLNSIFSVVMGGHLENQDTNLIFLYLVNHSILDSQPG